MVLLARKRFDSEIAVSLKFLDFLSDALAEGRRFRILAIVDDFTREGLTLVADTSRPGLRARASSMCSSPSRPTSDVHVSDNGPELTGMTLLRFSLERQIEWHYIAPGKPTAERLHREFQRPPARRTSQ